VSGFWNLKRLIFRSCQIKCYAFSWQKMILVFSILICFHPFAAFSQNDTIKDTINKHIVKAKPISQHSPHKATIYSMVLPGLGQAYNHKYWKIPVVYAGFGVLAYYISTNNTEYQKFKKAYTYVVNGDSTAPPPNSYVKRYNKSSTSLLAGKDYYRRRLELSYICTAAWYILNVLDATVDAHFFDYDISNDLTLRVEPVITPNYMTYKPSGGVKLTLRF